MREAQQNQLLLEAPDGLLAERAADGDIDAFEVLARRYGPLMRVYAAKLLGSDVESDDVVQEAFLTAWRQLDHLTEPQAVKSWLMRMVTNRAIDRMRVRKNHDDIDDYEPPTRSSDDPERLVEAKMQMQALSRALTNLPENQRQAWVLKELAGCSYGEIADTLGLPASTVRGILVRARKTLMHEMEEWR
ncbi:RNA polymerase subunit sigma-70 [Frondihabitans sp. PAMC 28766]|uniref:RNA polymerase sigma factor n=1 Tax=Frondihabitans sp. PAMC 28766 TaxID=1795630 RepID=UPI00078E243F|nr:sigma-70 family RNA polymerase sigma factor [Frondihabitans sp. PAMC 28766]AMM20163.1 RNA polymerase subunit sigma-70 [Frondihabitans sp. PAMC 28766]